MFRWCRRTCNYYPFRLFVLSGSLVKSSQQVVGIFKGIGAIGEAKAFDGFFQLSSGEVAFSVSSEAFAQQHECVSFQAGIAGGLLQQGDGFAELLDMAGGQSLCQFELLFEIGGIEFDTECVEFQFFLHDVLLQS